MKMPTEIATNEHPNRAFVLAERWILSVAMWTLAFIVERRLIRAIKRSPT